MEVEQSVRTRAEGWKPGPSGRRLREAYPRACILGCSTAGEILGSKVSDETVVATAVSFSSTTLRGAPALAAGIGSLGSRASLENFRHSIAFLYIISV
jgi:hypothetical protein